MSDTPQEPPKGIFAKFFAMPVDSVPRTVITAVVLCLACSMVVSVAAVSLRPIQQANQLVDKQRNILEVAGLYQPGVNIAEAFKAFEPRVVDLESGTFTDQFDPLTFDDAAAADDPELSIALDSDPAGIGRRANYRTVYLLNDDQGQIDKVILPIHGYGLWSTLYGFIALENDGNEIYGLQFYQHGETPGLGAEVDNPRWKALWNGKYLRDDEGALKITVAKGPASSDMIDYQVDALAGATLTSVGVDNLVKYWMGEDGFAPFIANLQQGGV